MIKKQQKWIAILVVCTFAWLMHLSAMPVAAAGSSGQASTVSSEQGPDYLEAVGQKAAPAKKKSILPWILIGAGVITVTALVLILIVLKGYDITGQWSMTYTWEGSTPGTVTLTFSGEKKSGTMLSSSGATANYTVDGKNVTWTYTNGTVYTGTFTDKDAMNGTMRHPAGDTGTWLATRSAAATSTGVPAQKSDRPESEVSPRR
jgi:hypothetical protein